MARIVLLLPSGRIEIDYPITQHPIAPKIDSSVYRGNPDTAILIPTLITDKATTAWNDAESRLPIWARGIFGFCFSSKQTLFCLFYEQHYISTPSVSYQRASVQRRRGTVCSNSR